MYDEIQRDVHVKHLYSNLLFFVSILKNKICIAFIYLNLFEWRPLRPLIDYPWGVLFAGNKIIHFHLKMFMLLLKLHSL